MALFEGAGVALITPFKDNGEVNYEKLEELLEEQIAGGTDSIVICGTTGEASTMTHEEHLNVIKYTCEVVNKRIPVVAGTGSNCTETAVYLSKEAEKYGADGLLLVSPYYNKATQNGLIAHFTAVADAVKIPIILYNIPGRTGVTIAPQTIVTLCKNVPNIVGVKEASGNISNIATMLAMADGCVDVYSGNDDQIVPLLSRRKGRRFGSVQCSACTDPRDMRFLFPRRCERERKTSAGSDSADRRSVLRSEPDSG